MWAVHITCIYNVCIHTCIVGYLKLIVAKSTLWARVPNCVIHISVLKHAAVEKKNNNYPALSVWFLEQSFVVVKELAAFHVKLQ